MKTKEIRSRFLDYFVQKNHTLVKSSSLIPMNDPSLLFTNAGMNQFKDVFLGMEKRVYVRATSSQKCVRAGGKHNDLENVGYTARHHTFFEMLGNFSFGDYFKKEALFYAWEFLTKVINIPQEKLYVTVYHTDEEAYDIWVNLIGVPSHRVIRIGDKIEGGSDNFWQMGDVGPCGPCSEIFYDHGPQISGGLPGTQDEDGDRYIEIWNCVFMQYNRDKTGKLNLLPKPSVDTGMGLERISAVLQNVHSNYDTDLFVSLITSIAKILKYNELSNNSLKVIADHIRSISFLIADGCIPSNEGRGYVLRRIIRRAIRHGYILGEKTPFLFKLVDSLVRLMGDPYEELIVSQEKIELIIKQEEEKFFQTLIDGMEILKSELSKDVKVLAGAIAFKLYDTYGFPLDLTQDICKEYNINVDIDSYNQCMQVQKNLAKNASKFKNNMMLEYISTETKFEGYQNYEIDAKVIALYKDEQLVSTLYANDEGIIILDKTVMYPESGGQIGDIGQIKKTSEVCLFNVRDTKKLNNNVIGHFGLIAYGKINVGDEVEVSFDKDKRLSTMKNHSATHLLHKALKLVLGDSVNQKGSYVCSEYTRFDFSYDKPLTKQNILDIENLVNNAILSSYMVETKTMKYDDAIKYGAVALFGEKYSEEVRVLCFSDFSVELCGGTHVKNTSDISLMLITNESGVSSGVRRIEAITGAVAIKYAQSKRETLFKINELLKTKSEDQILNKISFLNDYNKSLLKRVSELQLQILTLQLADFKNKLINLLDGNKLLLVQLQNMDNKTIIDFLVILKNNFKSCIFIIVNIVDININFTVNIPDLLKNKYSAMKIVKYMSNEVGGSGGGSVSLAQGGGSDIKKLSLLVNSMEDYLNSIEE